MSKSLSNDASAVNDALQDPAPKIDMPTSVEVNLLRGYHNVASNEWLNKAIIRELTGEDEEALATYDLRNEVSYSEYMTALLKRAVLSIDDMLVKDNPNMVDDLIIGDRDLLFLGIIKATYGRYRVFNVTCQKCEGANDVTVDLEKDFAIKDKDKELNLRIPTSVKLKNGTSIELNYPTGGDSQYVSKKAKTTAEQNTHMLARCAVLPGMSRPDAEAWARKLNLADRNTLVKSLLAVQPGPRMEEVDTQCAHCGAKITLALDWVSLLFG